MRVVARTEIGRELWDAFVDASDEAWLWHRYDFQSAYARWPGRRDVSVAIVDASDAIHGVVPAHIVTQRGLRRLECFGGPATALASAQGGDTVALGSTVLRDLRRRHRALWVDVTLAVLAPRYLHEPARATIRAEELGLTARVGATWMVDLELGEEVLWSRLHRTARSDVRRAERAGVTVRVAEQADLDAYYELHVETSRRSGLAAHPRDYFEDIWSNFLPAGLASIFLASHDGVDIAAANFGIYKRSVCYWTGASAAQARGLGASHLLQWRAMEEFVRSGLERFDSGEASLDARAGKHHSISEFKRKFGGEAHPLVRGRIALSPLSALLRLVEARR